MRQEEGNVLNRQISEERTRSVPLLLGVTIALLSPPTLLAQGVPQPQVMAYPSATLCVSQNSSIYLEFSVPFISNYQVVGVRLVAETFFNGISNVTGGDVFTALVLGKDISGDNITSTFPVEVKEFQPGDEGEAHLSMTWYLLFNNSIITYNSSYYVEVSPPKTPILNMTVEPARIYVDQYTNLTLTLFNEGTVPIDQVCLSVGDEVHTLDIYIKPGSSISTPLTVPDSSPGVITITAVGVGENGHRSPEVMGEVTIMKPSFSPVPVKTSVTPLNWVDNSLVSDSLYLLQLNLTNILNYTLREVYVSVLEQTGPGTPVQVMNTSLGLLGPGETRSLVFQLPTSSPGVYEVTSLVKVGVMTSHNEYTFDVFPQTISLEPLYTEVTNGGLLVGNNLGVPVENVSLFVVNSSKTLDYHVDVIVPHSSVLIPLVGGGINPLNVQVFYSVDGGTAYVMELPEVSGTQSAGKLFIQDMIYVPIANFSHYQQGVIYLILNNTQSVPVEDSFLILSSENINVSNAKVTIPVIPSHSTFLLPIQVNASYSYDRVNASLVYIQGGGPVVLTYTKDMNLSGLAPNPVSSLGGYLVKYIKDREAAHWLALFLVTAYDLVFFKVGPLSAIWLGILFLTLVIVIVPARKMRRRDNMPKRERPKDEGGPRRI